ncbi:hypothetical protein JOD82_002224 [Paenibacillus sp. 1182]|uniref:hypothetical protein n=1 Tax=Paenibacillus sp. 1182 TaxID=2806565 RepID=UPI001AE3A40B|nr:hypothetical protein [Paenibacillus sp. 1182]MBP1309204.1 hypothetical protein [Paenibacillus sp. 1182]
MDVMHLRNEAETKEPYQQIRLDADGGIDIDGEWQFSGTYSVLVPVNTIGNSYPYKGSVYKPSSSKGKSRWKVRLEACGGEYGCLSLQILHESATSLKDGRKMIANSIIAFEATNRYKEELWPKILDSDRLVLIFKEVNGAVRWVATTWVGAWAAIQGKTTWYSFELPCGSGQFYYREMKWRNQYKHNTDGTKDWSSCKRVKEPRYGSIKVSGGCCTGNIVDDHEVIKKINQAIRDLLEK